MSKHNLKEQNEILSKEITILKEEIKSLNENTVIQSMNDMKERYEELNRESVPIEEYEDLLSQIKTLSKLISTTDMINNLNLSKICNISYYIENHNEQDTEDMCLSENKLSERFMSICRKDLSNITNNCKLIQEFINNECQCE